MEPFERRSLYWVLAILVIVIAPFIVLLTPAVVSVIVFDDPNKIAFISFGKSLLMYSIAFFIAFCALLILYFVKNLIKKIYIIIISLISFFAIYSTGLSHYVYLNENYIEYNPLFGSKVIYSWSELSDARHIYPDGESVADEHFIFTFSDGYAFRFKATGSLDTAAKSRIYTKLQLYSIPFIGIS
ncbi:hypothetical protein [Ureibacillus sinduriensis]|uniref:Uncharacterized protein n=1 Tax=Ureibacillus sinduriensis BLB-1 = JCM 15800 TaxID=1384057 RepID=A0A0A3IUA7_9BACL|nr:hypothetical protein [Ureibacillus sinduriensis]KGR78422.1 hypothetical protein CD33_01265 [Ureibacillus sinduriensis BLB-1 = JCM 15800]